MYKPPVKFSGVNRPILSTPNIDVEEYSRLRSRPYPQQSSKNLPYYYIEPKMQVPRLYMSDLDKLPLDKINFFNANKLKNLYVCLREECCFKRHLLDEKQLIGNDFHLNWAYDNEISASTFRIFHVKDDIVQFTHYLRLIYNLDGKKFDSVKEAGLSCVLSAIDFKSLMEITSAAMYMQANISMFLWCCVFEIIIVRLQTYIYLTLSNYADGTGFTAWSFCPYLKGFGISLLLTEVTISLLHFWEAPLALIQGWYSSFISQTSTCGDVLNDIVKTEELTSSLFNVSVGGMTVSESPNDLCYHTPNQFTRNMQCSMDPKLIRYPQIFNSNFFYLFIRKLSNMSRKNLALQNLFLYIFTVIMWLIVTRVVRIGFSSLIPNLHRGTVLSLIFCITVSALTAATVETEILEESSSAFFSINSSFFDVSIILKAFMHTLRQSLIYYLEIGPKLPYRWHPEGVYLWNAAAFLTLTFFTMWYSYVAVYNEKHFYESKDVSCFLHNLYIANSAIPRLLYKISGNCSLAVLYYFLQVFVCFTVVSTKIAIVWENINSNIAWIKKIPRAQYIYDVVCLTVILVSMMRIKGCLIYVVLSGTLISIHSYVMTFIAITIDTGVLFYYSPTRIWGDLQYLTKRRIPLSTNVSYIGSMILTFIVVVMGLPIMLKDFDSTPIWMRCLITVALFGPFLTTSTHHALTRPASNERQFNFWGKRSHNEQYERFKFIACKFQTSRLKLQKFYKYERGEDFYRAQRTKALIRLAAAVQKTR